MADGFDNMWNRRGIPKPDCVDAAPLKTTLKEERIHDITSKLSKLSKDLSVPALWKEKAILKTIIYKHNNQQRSQKEFRGIKLVHRDLERLKEHDIADCLSDYLKHWPGYVTTKNNNIQSESMSLPHEHFTEFVLLKLMGAAQLIAKVISLCQRTASYIQSHLALGFFVTLNITTVSMMSRIWVLLKDMLLNVTDVYQITRPLMDQYHTTCKSVSSDVFPESLVTWLGLDISKERYNSSQNTTRQHAQNKSSKVLMKMFSGKELRDPTHPSTEETPPVQAENNPERVEKSQPQAMVIDLGEPLSDSEMLNRKTEESHVEGSVKDNLGFHSENITEETIRHTLRNKDIVGQVQTRVPNVETECDGADLVVDSDGLEEKSVEDTSLSELRAGCTTDSKMKKDVISDAVLCEKKSKHEKLKKKLSKLKKGKLLLEMFGHGGNSETANTNPENAAVLKSKTPTTHLGEILEKQVLRKLKLKKEKKRKKKDRARENGDQGCLEIGTPQEKMHTRGVGLEGMDSTVESNSEKLRKTLKLLKKRSKVEKMKKDQDDGKKSVNSRTVEEPLSLRQKESIVSDMQVKSRKKKSRDERNINVLNESLQEEDRPDDDGGLVFRISEKKRHKDESKDKKQTTADDRVEEVTVDEPPAKKKKLSRISQFFDFESKKEDLGKLDNVTKIPNSEADWSTRREKKKKKRRIERVKKSESNQQLLRTVGKSNEKHKSIMGHDDSSSYVGVAERRGDSSIEDIFSILDF